MSKLFLMLLAITFCYGLLEQDQCFLDVNDILNEDLMPGSLMLLGDVDLIKKSESDDNLQSRTIDSNTNDSILDDGGWDQAYSTMGYHR